MIVVCFVRPCRTVELSGSLPHASQFAYVHSVLFLAVKLKLFKVDVRLCQGT